MLDPSINAQRCYVGASPSHRHLAPRASGLSHGREVWCLAVDRAPLVPSWAPQSSALLPSSSQAVQASTSEGSPTMSRSSSFRMGFWPSKRQQTAEEPELIPQRCSNCGGSGSCTCTDCSGRGRLSRAGYNKRNRLDMTRIVGSKWTSMEETMGWRHFRVIQCRKGASGVAFVQLQASCDTATQLWMNSSNLKDRDMWAAGWLQKSEMEDPQSALTSGVTCRACSGSGTTPCPVCDATGAVMRPPSGLGGPLSSVAAAAAAAAEVAEVAAVEGVVEGGGGPVMARARNAGSGGGGDGGSRSSSPLGSILRGSMLGVGGVAGGSQAAGGGETAPPATEPGSTR